MSDITTKLRSGDFGWLPELNEAAADEIDRLRAEVANLRECGLAIGALSSAIGNPCVEANENGIPGGLVALALRRIDVRDKWYADALNELDEKRSEIARLREALERIAKTRIGLDPNDSDQEWREYWAEVCHQYRQIARAALAPVEVGK